MNPIEVGKMFERQAENMLKREGFKIVEHSSLREWSSPYDFIISKSGIEYYLEVRGRFSGGNQNYFMFSKKRNHGYSWKDYFMLMSKGVSEK